MAAIITQLLNDGKLLLVGDIADGHIGGLAINLYAAVLALGVGFVLALPLGVARSSRRRMARWPAQAYIEFVKAMPILLFVFWLYLLLPVITPLSLPATTSAIVCFAIYSSAYLAEVVRAGIESVPEGQYEAAISQGFGSTGALVHVVLPQALRNMIPCFASFLISIFKDTSVLYIIGIADIYELGVAIAEHHPARLAQIYMEMGLMLFVVCFALSSAARWLERRLGMAHCQECEALAWKRGIIQPPSTAWTNKNVSEESPAVLEQTTAG